MARKTSLSVQLVGRGPIKLTDANYITAGGEGAIYRAGNSAVKIYTDPDKMARDDIPGKVKLLSRLQRVGIVAPEGLVVDDQKKPVGFYMPFAGGDPLSRFFTSDYRVRIGFGDNDAVELAADMHSIVSYTHGKKVVMVDANELNWLVSFTKGAVPRAIAIDVDSWAVDRWKASVIMPSIRDWNRSVFDEISDWFAWGVVSFQIFTGIHPFKGKIDGYKPGEMVQRMKDGASVFDKRAKLPLAVRDFSCIPGPLLDWYREVFQQGLRSHAEPPHPYNRSRPAQAAQVMRAVTTAATGALIFEKRFERVGDPAVRIWPNGAVRLASGETCDLETGKTITWLPHARCEIVRDADGWVVANPAKNLPDILIQHVSLDGKDVSSLIKLPIAANRIFRAGERLFAITDREMVEIKRRKFSNTVVTTGGRWSIMPNAVTWLDDVAVQDVLGAAFLIMVHDAGVYQVRVPELDGVKLVAGKAGGRFAAFTAAQPNGTYRKIELAFDRSFGAYKVWVGSADSAELNMGIMPRGVVGTIVNDFEFAIVVPGQGTVKTINDPGISTAMKLAAWGEKLVYVLDGAVWQLRTS